MMKKIIFLIAFSLSFNAEAFMHNGGPIPPIPILDTVTCQSASDAAYGTVKLRSNYSGHDVEMRVKQSGVYVYQDIDFNINNYIDSAAADTFAATADAGTPAELRFYDQCGNGNHATFVSTAVKGATWSPYPLGNTPMRTAAFDDLYNNSVTSPSTKQELVLPSAVAMNMDAFSVVFIGRRDTDYPPSGKPISYWELKNGATWYSDWYSLITDSGDNIRESSGVKLNYGTTETGAGVSMNIMTSSTSTLRTNESVLIRSKAALNVTSAGGSIGLSPNLSASYNGGQDIVAQIFYNRTLTSGEQGLVDSYGYSLVGDPTAANTCIVTIGDSGTQAEYQPYNMNPINQAISNVAIPINKPVRVYATATSGNTAAEMLANITRYTGTCANTGITTKIAVISAGANDLVGGATPAQAVNTLHSLWTAMHNAGFKVVCVTAQNAQVISGTVATFNGLIESTYAANNCDALADTWLDPNIGAGSDNTNLTYWYTDRIHLATSGNQIVGQYEANAINTVD